ncbi:Na-Ca exchanger/integrin-beta4 [Caldithrix abyssi DSM 13497]|uniref:Na-Ca exchanger/integrin-beta4 n=2 Tax=Caldithrix abyssi DSM 13497 TaxID=880073 RepID=H1XXX7_CALAY|nr:Na-Ca exchanger/integrin-beta4 [Caldithrix abyssi DSM 13497]
MRKLLAILSFVFMPVFIFSQATLSTGDVAIVGLNCDNPDEFSFVVMVDIPPNSEVKFTDNGVKSDGTFRTGEGIITWTSPSTQLTAGTVINIKNDGAWSTSEGTVSVSGGFYLSTSGDQIIVYQGSESDPTYIYALNDQGTGWQSDATNSNDSALPPGLSDGYTAIALDEIDNAVYNESVTSGTKSELLTAISNKANWNGDNDNRQTMPTGPFTVIESNNTTVQFATASGTADEGAGTYDLVVTIANPDANNATTADVVLVSGDPADLGNYTTQTVTFPAGSSADQIVTITITDDSEVEGDEDFTFQLQNVSGGNGAMAGSPSQHVLTITDNDFADVPDIVINEIMQNPSAVDDSKGEWFELYNNDTETVDINGWIIKDDGVDYHVIDNGGPLTIAPGEYLVLGNNDTTTVNGGVPVDYMYDNFLLSNSDDEVVLVYSDGVTEVDRVNYDGGPNFPDPSGASMELKNPNYDNNDGANWDTATTPFGDGDLGTPGARNSNFVSALEDAPALNVESFKIMQNYPNPFNPETKLLVHLSSNVRQLKIDIFNAAGQHVKSIYQGALSAGQHTFSWNGRDNSGKNSPSGVYFATMKSANAQHSIKMILLR